MNVRFNLNYNTRFGEKIGIKITHDSNEEIHYLSYINNGNWFLEKEFHLPFLTYIYFFENENGQRFFEWNEKKVNFTQFPNKTIDVFDFYSKANFPENYFNTRPFQLTRGTHEYSSISLDENQTHIFKISAPLYQPNWELYLTGNHECLGNWKPNRSLKMTETSFGTWELPIDLKEITHVIQYKYLIINTSNNQVVAFENGENRFIHPNSSSDKINLINDLFFRYPKEILWKKAGVALPVFSLRTNESFGVGEFLDLKLFAQFATSCDFKLIQILPINDTTANYSWTDSYPYAAISVYALHPIYLNLENLSYPLNKTETTSYKKIQKELNAFDSVQYDQVMKHKWSFLRKIFERNQKSIEKDPDFLAYIDKNKSWLYPYAGFCVLRDIYKTPDFSKWKTHSNFTTQEIEEFFSPTHDYYKEAMLYAYVQYELHRQLSDAVAYLHQFGISLKGDLPIGIYRYSVEAWTEPDYFGMDFQAGAPPDDFAVLGQNWEFPTYNWTKMKQDDYQWWKNRFQNMSQYFDAFRIDHILGFFRIWRMPISAVQGILGYFYPALPFAKSELWERGIHFNYERYVLPFINQEIIEKYFQKEAKTAQERLFQIEPDGRLIFKEFFNTQRKIENLSKNDPWIKKHKETIFTLLANVLFLEEKTSTETLYHPRFFLYTTDSYHYLDDLQKKNLYDLYVYYFFQRQEHLWYEQGMEKLPVLKKTTDMLTCGEDLGLVPRCVPEVMNDLAILSLQVQRMPAGDLEFSDPQKATYLNVVTPATHDTSTLRQWWEENPQLIQNYYTHQIRLPHQVPEKLNPEIATIIFRQHLYSDAMLAIFPFQDLLALDYDYYKRDKDTERINIPAIFPHYWNYRMQMTVEDLIKHDPFIFKIKKDIQGSGRG